jgi:hypothetical protein
LEPGISAWYDEKRRTGITSGGGIAPVLMTWNSSC